MKKERGKKAEKRKELDEFCELARKLGAKDAKIVAAKDVFTAQWTRLKCQFGCGGYGSSSMCPPHSPSPEETRKVLDGYESALLVHFGDSNSDVSEVIVELERKVFLSGFYKALGLGAGPCELCSACDFDDCKYPEKARPSMEASGIDVFKTARKAGFPIEVLTSTRREGNYYGLVLIE